MASSVVFLSSIFLAVMVSTATAQTAKPPPSIAAPTPAPAPAPAPQFVNLTDLLSVAGPYKTFLSYLIKTQVIETFQNQANNTEQGITIFAPTDAAFASLKKPSLSNLTSDQLKTLLLFHALPKYYSLAEFRNLSMSNPVSTFAGGQYALNFSDASGLIRVDSGWSNPKISSSVFSTRPVAVYQVQSVLLPTAIFGTPPPPAPAPAPAPDSTKPSDLAPSSSNGTTGSPTSTEASTPSSAPMTIGFNAIGYLVSVTCGALVMLQ